MSLKTNHFSVEGNLTNDVQSNPLQSGKTVYNFQVAYNHRNETSYFWIEAWDNAIKGVKDLLTKGAPVEVEGTLKQERWAEGEEKKSRIKLIARNITVNNTK